MIRSRRPRRPTRVFVMRPRRNTITYPNRTARFGAKTIAGAGAFRPTDSAGNAYNLTSYDSLVSGSLGSYVPSILNGGLRFTGGGAGAPAGAVLRCTHANGQIDITIGSLVANTYSVADLTEASAAYGGSVLGDTIELRAGSHNASMARVLITRSTTPTGTWTGTSALSDGNWITLTRDPGATVTIGAIEVSSNGTNNPRYLRINDLDFVAGFNGDSNGFFGSVNGIVTLAQGSHIAVTNCRISHSSAVNGTTTGTMRAIHSAGLGSVWIEGNTIDGARHGLHGGRYEDSVIRKNTFRRILSDAIFVLRGNNAIIEGNVITDKLNGYSVQTILGIARGATTVVTVASAASATVGEPCSFEGVSGALGAAINKESVTVASKTTTTITLNINTSAMPDWDGVAGTLQILGPLHGDHIQFSDNPGAANLQDNVTVRGNVWTRGAADGNFTGGQGLFVGGLTYTRSNWLVEGNIYCDVVLRGISIAQAVNCTIRSNTVVRQLGIKTFGGAIPSIVIDGASSSGNTVADNVANAYSLLGVTSDIGNATVTLVNNNNIPADATSIANYQAAFVDPVTSPGFSYDAVARFATRTDVGSVFPGPIYPGATPYMDYDTLVYTNPR